VSDRPLPDLEDPLHAPFWAAAGEGRLVVQRCAGCSQFRWPPRPRCAECGSYDFDWPAVSPRASLFSWIVVRQAFMPAFSEVVPYVVAIVELEAAGRVRMLGNLFGGDPEGLRPGLRLVARFDVVAPGVTLVNWTPA